MKITKAKPDDKRERVNLIPRKEFEVSYYCGSGAGGQARNKVASAVMIRHPLSGAIGRCSEHRSQEENKQEAFKRLLETPKMKLYINRKLFELRERETFEAQVEREVQSANVKFEIKNALGQWEEVTEDYFNGPAAKGE